jgi:hypothetical protein
MDLDLATHDISITVDCKSVARILGNVTACVKMLSVYWTVLPNTTPMDNDRAKCYACEHFLTCYVIVPPTPGYLRQSLTFVLYA